MQWVNGTWRLFNSRYSVPLVRALNSVDTLYAAGCRPRSLAADWLQHVARESNTLADCLARRATDTCVLHRPFPWPTRLLARCDGGTAARAGAGCGWVLWGCPGADDTNAASSWVQLASASWLLPSHSLPLEAEFSGLLSLLRFVIQLIVEGCLDGGLLGEPGESREDRVRASARPQLWPRLAWRAPYAGAAEGHTTEAARTEDRRGATEDESRRATSRRRV